MDEKLTKLTAMGFKLAGRWSRGDAGIFFELVDCATARNVLYAFVVDGQLMYVGKTVQSLRARMAGYKNPGPTQSTNIRNNKDINDSLAKGQQVEIFVLPDNGLLHYGGFHVNLSGRFRFAADAARQGHGTCSLSGVVPQKPRRRHSLPLTKESDHGEFNEEDGRERGSYGR